MRDTITAEQVKAQYRRNAEQVSEMAEKARAVIGAGATTYRGYTLYEWERNVRDAWNRAWLTTAELAPVVSALNGLTAPATAQREG